MIVGIGTDIVNIKRIEHLIFKFGDRFLKRIFTPQEIKESQKFSSLRRSSSYLAKRFAAKEAYAKATGLGIRNQITFNQIEILNDDNGRPFIILHSRTKEHLLNSFSLNKTVNIHLSLSDDYPLALAYIIIETI